MPKARFVWERISDADRRMAAEIRAAASETSVQRHRWLDYLEMFIQVNPEAATMSPDEVYSLMGAQWMARGNQASSAINMLEFFEQFHVDPANIGRTRRRLEVLRVLSGIRRMADNKGKLRPRRLPDRFLPGITPNPPDCERERSRQTYWALACVTGNRCGNLLTVRRLEVTASSVIVFWGVRKVHSNVRVEYPFSWSEKPPAWILERWKRFNTEGWPFPQGCDMAANVQRWLEKWNLGLDSTSMREYLDMKTFRPLVLEQMKMLPQQYGLVMDHDIQTSIKHYASGC